MTTQEIEAPIEQETDITHTGFEPKVILLNDEIHSFDEVIVQVMKAISCSEGRAEEIAHEVHNKGKAVVYSGEMQECLKVSSVLEEIALHTQIES